MLAVGRRLAVDGGRRALRRSSDVAWVRRCVRIWSITADGVMNATIRIGPAQCGHASGSTSKICCSNAAQR